MTASLTAAGRRFLELLASCPDGRRRLSWMDSRPAQRLLDAGHIEETYEVVRTRPNGKVVEDFFVKITDAGRRAIAGGEQEAPGVAPATVEGSESRDAVVGASADGDHAVVGTAPGVTPSAGELIEALQQWEPESPVYLDILGDLIDIAEVHPFNSCHGGGIRIVGVEVVE